MELKKGQTYITKDEQTAFKLRNGSMDVFLVPMDRGVQGRPMFVLRVEEGMTIPAMAYTDDDYIGWHFRFAAIGDCDLQVIDKGVTRPLKKRFCRAVSDGEDDQSGGMESLLREKYMSRMIRDDVLITTSERMREHVRENARDVLRQTVKGDGGADEGRAPGAETADRKRPGRGRVKSSATHTLSVGLAASAACTIAAFVLIMASLERSPSPVLPAGLMLTFIVILWLARRRIRRQAESAAMAEQETIYRKLYQTPEFGGDAANERAKAIDVIGRYDRLRLRRTERAEGVLFLMVSAGVCVITIALFPVPGMVAAGTALVSGAILRAFVMKALRRKAAVARDRDRAELGLLEAFYRIEKVRLAGATEFIVRKYYLDKQKEKLRERRNARGRSAEGTVAAAAFAAGITATLMCVHYMSGLDPRGELACGFGCTVFFCLIIFGVPRLALAPDGAGDPEAEPLSPASREEEARERSEWIEALDGAAPGDVLLELDHASLSRGGREICRDISMRIGKGEHIGIVGPSGSGKTMLMKMISGREAPDEGSAFFLGRRMGRREVEALHSVSGTVLQNDQLLTASIRDNLLAGADAGDETDLRQAVGDDGLGEDIGDMPMGYDTLIREDGENVSAGQKQKLLIARALTGAPRILFFDEAESELNREQQEHIRRALRGRNVTVVSISHQYPTVRKCDKIAVIEEGRIVEWGTPEELTAKKGSFYTLMHRQM